MSRFDLTTSRVVRWVGIAGLLFEILVDHLRNPTALVVFGGLAEGPDLFAYWSRSKEDPPEPPELPEEVFPRAEKPRRRRR